MANYVLVHGGDVSTETWNKLSGEPPVHTENGRLGWMVWERIMSILESQGHKVFAPTLINEYESNLTGHIEQIVRIISENNLSDVILTGHSYGGMIITGVASRIPEKIRHMVYADAAIPDIGQCLYDVICGTNYDPKLITGLDPAPAYIEKLYFDPLKIKHLPKTYIRCTQSEVAAVTEAIAGKIKKDEDNWTILYLPTVHVFQATMPDEFARMLLAIVEA